MFEDLMDADWHVLDYNYENPNSLIVDLSFLLWLSGFQWFKITKLELVDGELEISLKLYYRGGLGNLLEKDLILLPNDIKRLKLKLKTAFGGKKFFSLPQRLIEGSLNLSLVPRIKSELRFRYGDVLLNFAEAYNA